MVFEQQFRAAIAHFAERLRTGALPIARERELVSLFALGELRDAIAPNSPLSDIRQIGIEVAVTQTDAANDDRKKAICKDLVVWPGPEMTLWSGDENAPNVPLAVIEWKTVSPSDSVANATRGWAKDQAWLRGYVTRFKSVEGYSVFVRTDQAMRPMRVVRIAAADLTPGTDWFPLGGASPSLRTRARHSL